MKKETKQRGVIGTWWNNLADAKKDAKKKTRCEHFPFLVLQADKGFMVVSEEQLK